MNAPPHTPSDSDSQDAALMLQVRQGDTRAMESLITKYQQSVYATVARMLNNGGDVEDIAQQVFIRVWKYAARYEPTARFSTWLFTILRNLVFNELRRQRRKGAVSLQETVETYGTEPSLAGTADGAPYDSLEQKELTAAIDRAMTALPEKERLAIQLRTSHDMPYEDIAAVLGISVSATKSLLFRTRQALKTALRSYLD